MKSQSLTIKITTLFCIVSIDVTDAGRMWFCKSDDPCKEANTTAPYQPKLRAKNCQFNKTPYCDRFITPGWYRFKDDMLNHPPDLFECGAVYPYWLNGTLPSKQDEEVDRTACKVGFRKKCTRQVTITIRHCGSFNAYCLPYLGACSERYCFGERDAACDQTTPNSPRTATPPTVTKRIKRMTGSTSEKPKAPSIESLQNRLLAEICSADPCKSNDLPRIPFVKSRGENCKYKHTMQSCDRDLVPGWYKAETGDPKLLNRCPDVLSCGALYPVWMDGMHPNKNEGIVQRELCIFGLGLGNSHSCCHERSHIYVKNCGLYMAYCLKPLNKCEERYCFDNNETCTDDTDMSVDSSLLHREKITMKNQRSWIISRTIMKHCVTDIHI
ncbi:uncharacterized protein LOC133176006 isoform X2 [Saccostrea echinata]|uniref:uncharacterized protein LOC133176006 isoform X2 n=1 Tax=Saccostrea echinata TaxID=191078 RepID=UPI002A83899C|nr:uncharacterized protein LOC133176006 isoform X2 [Saccostrea echinata]